MDKGGMIMVISENAQKYHERMFPGYESKLLKTDPEFIVLFDNFAFDEVVNQCDLDELREHCQRRASGC